MLLRAVRKLVQLFLVVGLELGILLLTSYLPEFTLQRINALKSFVVTKILGNAG